MNSPIHEFKVMYKGQRAFQNLINGVVFLIHYFEKQFKPCFFILKAFKDIMQHFDSCIGEFVVLFFDATNRLTDLLWAC